MVTRMSSRKAACSKLVLGVVLSLLPGAAHARVMQTSGEVVPQLLEKECDGNAQICINDNEKQQGGAGDIDAIATATISQETFSPLCELSFTVVGRGASYKNTFGWYAVSRDGKGKTIAPQLSQMHVFLGCGDGIGAQKTLKIPMGVSEIGFFLANDEGHCVATKDDPLGPVLTSQPTNLFLSQREFNSDGDNLIHLLVWQSHAQPNAFYFGWEDKSGGGDNDFEDLLTFVTGIQCTGGGEPCDIPGKLGVCAEGVRQCRDGTLACVATQEPSAEKCNGLDDDCDGNADNGDGLCAKNEVCVRGRCEPKCGTGEFRCGAGQVCTNGVCVQESCAEKSCAAGSICVEGECREPCEGVACPFGQACRGGACADVCANIECDSGFACEPRPGTGSQGLIGVCTSCDCRGCGDGQTCSAHLCVDDSCAQRKCQAGTHCVAGNCVDDCDGAKCPNGEHCAAGACVPDSGVGGGPISGNGDGGDSGGLVIDPGSGGSAGQGASRQGDGARDSKGCGCQAPGRDAGSSAVSFIGLLLAGVRARRARRR